MNGQQIPGFYYDPEKKKYFKIQSASASCDPNLKYSAQNVRKQERQDRLQHTLTSRIKRTKRERVVRKHASNLIQTNLDREIGFRRRSFYTHDAWPSACTFGISTRQKQIVDSPPIRRFDCDAMSKTIYAVHGENSIKRRRIHKDDEPPLPNPDLDADDYLAQLPLNSYSFSAWEELQRTTSSISSLTYLPTTGALAATTYGSDRPPVVYLSDPDRDGPYVGQQFTPKGCNAIWGASARPTSFSHSTSNSTGAHTEHLAVAASNSMLLFTRSQSGSWDSQSVVNSLGSDILALDWISYTTVALGCRNGKIHLYDTRSRGSSHILTHPHSVAKCKRADDQTRLVVSGLQDSLVLYDIRAPRSTTLDAMSQFGGTREHHHKKRRKTQHGHGSYNKKVSQPILTFPHANLDDLQLDIDIHPRLGLLAAGQDPDSEIGIKVSNIWTGKCVKEFRRNASKTGKAVEKIGHVKFIHDDENSSKDYDSSSTGGVKLWSSWAGKIVEFAW